MMLMTNKERRDYMDILIPIYEKMIQMNISMKNINIIEGIIALCLFVFMIIGFPIIDSILEKHQKNRIYIGIIIITTSCLFTALFIIPKYQKYLESKLTTETYIVKKIAYNKESVVTDTNKVIENPSKKIKNVDEPTDDKDKIGKTYYTIKVYKPEQIKKLLNDVIITDNLPFSTKINKTYMRDKCQNQLTKHTYIQKYYDAK